MAKLVYVGPNARNRGLMSSKAYTIRRMRRSVIIHFGAVESVGAGGGKLYWVGAGPTRHKKGFPSETAAAAFVLSRVRNKVAHGYDRLPATVPIRRRGRS